MYTDRFVLEDKKWQQKALLKDKQFNNSSVPIICKALLLTKVGKQTCCQLQVYNLYNLTDTYNLMLTNKYYTLDMGYD